MLTKQAAHHTAKLSSVIGWSCRAQNVHAPEIYGYQIAAWHFRPDGFDVFAESFAENLVGHLRERGIEVEGSGRRSRACACGTRAETRQAHDCATHVRGADNECLMIDCDLKRVRARRDIWCTAAEYVRARH